MIEDGTVTERDSPTNRGNPENTQIVAHSICRLGRLLREAATKTELDRFRHLRDGLIDKAEAQMEADKLPGLFEIGLSCTSWTG